MTDLINYFNLRDAKLGDEQAIYGLIHELAVYEKEPDAVINTAEQLKKDLFIDKVCSCIVLEHEDTIVGMALYYTSYSTWRGRCLYLEDFYIQPAHRRKGGGEVIFNHLVDKAKKEGFKRMDWQVLDWNEPAISFYKKVNAELDAGWMNGRLYFN